MRQRDSCVALFRRELGALVRAARRRTARRERVQRCLDSATCHRTINLLRTLSPSRPYRMPARHARPNLIDQSVDSPAPQWFQPSSNA